MALARVPRCIVLIAVHICHPLLLMRALWGYLNACSSCPSLALSQRASAHRTNGVDTYLLPLPILTSVPTHEDHWRSQVPIARRKPGSWVLSFHKPVIFTLKCHVPSTDKILTGPHGQS
jgi:hypothetical protein